MSLSLAPIASPPITRAILKCYSRATSFDDATQSDTEEPSAATQYDGVEEEEATVIIIMYSYLAAELLVFFFFFSSSLLLFGGFSLVCLFVVVFCVGRAGRKRFAAFCPSDFFLHGDFL